MDNIFIYGKWIQLNNLNITCNMLLLIKLQISQKAKDSRIYIKLALYLYTIKYIIQTQVYKVYCSARNRFDNSFASK